MTEGWKARARSKFVPLARWLAKRGVKPDQLTYLGLCLSLLAALLLGRGDFLAAAFLIGLAGLCDVLDGDVARETGRVSAFGGFLDSTLDRVGEASLYAGLANYYYTRAQGGALWLQNEFRAEARWGDANGYTLAILALSTLILSFLVSYTRARAEALGLECRVGWFERPERMVVLIVAAAFGVGPVMPGALLLLTVLSFATAIQRVVYVWESTRRP